jgi:hypothetical protein
MSGIRWAIEAIPGEGRPGRPSGSRPPTPDEFSPPAGQIALEHLSYFFCSRAVVAA